MNGYQIHADNYRAYLEKHPDITEDERQHTQSKIKALEILAGLKEQDIYNLFNSGAFNEICTGYLLMTLDNIHTDRATREQAAAELKGLFDTTGAEQAKDYI